MYNHSLQLLEISERTMGGKAHLRRCLTARDVELETAINIPPVSAQ
jgi:hypothetical protein